MPAQFAVPGGLGLDELRDVLASPQNVVGVEVTAFEARSAVERSADRLIASIVRVLLP